MQPFRKNEVLVAGARILDTCSQPEEAVKAAMRALVSSDQTCLHPPLFLGKSRCVHTPRTRSFQCRTCPYFAGLVGPEDPESLQAALKVTGVFDTVHVVPFGGEDSEGASGAAGAAGGVLHVAKLDPQERAQVTLVLIHFTWRVQVIQCYKLGTN